MEPQTSAPTWLLDTKLGRGARAPKRQQKGRPTIGAQAVGGRRHPGTEGGGAGGVPAHKVASWLANTSYVWPIAITTNGSSIDAQTVQPRKLRRIDQRLIWPELTENLAPPSRDYALEEVWRCVICDATTVVINHFPSRTGEQFRQPDQLTQVYPVSPPRNLPAEAPPTVASLYMEASIAEAAGALRGAAGLLRATVEEITKLQGSTQKNLYDKIEGLKSAGVDADIIEDLHEARFLGNWSLHQGGTFTPDEIADVA